jgi:ATP-binding cassette subfamily B protein
MKNRKRRQNKDKSSKPNIFGLLKPYSGLVVLLVLVALLSNGVNLIIPKLIAHAIDNFSRGHYVFKTVLLEFSIATLAIFIFTYIQSVIQTYASERVARDLRSKLSDKISRQGYTFIIRANPSKLLTNLTSDIDSVKMFVSHAIIILVSSLFTIVATCILLLLINWKLALAVITIVPVIMITFFVVMKKAKVLFKRNREIIDLLNKVINESIMGSALIRVLNAQQPEYTKFMEANTEAKDLGISILKLFAVLIPIIMFVANLATVTILAMGGHFVIIGNISLGNFAAFNSYLSMLIFPIIMVGFMSNIIAQATASYNRIDELLQIPEIEETGTVQANLRGNIELKNVSLFYGDKPVLKNISFSIEGGDHTAIIGPTAAGKSQLLYLLTHLIEPTAGTIEFDHINIGSYNKDSFHSQIGFVFQDSVIFNISLRENIAFSDNVTDESLQKALETAELTDFIDSLPQRLDTIISERGTNLSGGQKQRIMLARALSLNPKILFLDDFTARVDRNTENKILCNLLNNYPELTLVTVTQKVASIKNFEKIILLMEGEIIATGTHKELKLSSTEYNQICNSQRSTHHYEL